MKKYDMRRDQMQPFIAIQPTRDVQSRSVKCSEPENGRLGWEGAYRAPPSRRAVFYVSLIGSKGQPI